MQVFAALAPTQRAIGFRALLPLVSDKAKRAWVHFTVDGTYEGHPSGPFKFDRAVNQQLIRNFEAQANPIPLTYEHPNYSDGQPKPAAGWVHELVARGDGLWGLCEFTDRSAEMVRAGEYRFTSVVVLFDSTDRKTGEPIGAELLEVALTNRPYIDGQKPIALTSARRLAKMEPVDLKAALLALGLAEDATEEQAKAALCAAMQLAAAQEGKTEEPEEKAPEPPADMTAELACKEPVKNSVELAPTQYGTPLAEPAPGGEGEAAGKDQAVKLLEDATGLDLAGVIAFLETNKDAIATMAGKAPKSAPPGTETDTDFEDPNARMSRDPSTLTLDTLASTVRTLAARIDGYEKRDAEFAANSRKADAETRVSLAVESGRILEGDRAKWLTLAVQSPEAFEQVISTLVPAVPTGRVAALTKPMVSKATDDADKDEVAKYDRALSSIVKDPKKRKEIALERIRSRRASEGDGSGRG